MIRGDECIRPDRRHNGISDISWFLANLGFIALALTIAYFMLRTREYSDLEDLTIEICKAPYTVHFENIEIAAGVTAGYGILRCASWLCKNLLIKWEIMRRFRREKPGGVCEGVVRVSRRA